MTIIIWVTKIITDAAKVQNGVCNQSLGQVGFIVAERGVAKNKKDSSECKKNVRRLFTLTILLGPTWLLGLISFFFGKYFLNCIQYIYIYIYIHLYIHIYIHIYIYVGAIFII